MIQATNVSKPHSTPQALCMLIRNITIITHERAEALRESGLQVSFEDGPTIVNNETDSKDE